MDLGFFSADTLGMTLYQVKGRLVSHEIHQTSLGPWRLGLPIKTESDILSAKEASFWMTVAEKLQMYVIVREKENWLFVLHSERLQAVEQQTRFEGATVKDRVLELKPAIRAVFHWEGSSWEQVQYDGSTTVGG